MEIIFEYTLESLTESSVSVVTKRYAMIEGVKTKVGETTSCCYNNCAYDRNRLYQILPENYFNAVVDVWGDEPLLENPDSDIQ